MCAWVCECVCVCVCMCAGKPTLTSAMLVTGPAVSKTRRPACLRAISISSSAACWPAGCTVGSANPEWPKEATIKLEKYLEKIEQTKSLKVKRPSKKKVGKIVRKNEKSSPSWKRLENRKKKRKEQKAYPERKKPRSLESENGQKTRMEQTGSPKVKRPTTKNWER